MLEDVTHVDLDLIKWKIVGIKVKVGLNLHLDQDHLVILNLEAKAMIGNTKYILLIMI